MLPVREALSRKVSRERVGAELEGMFQGPAPVRAVADIQRLGLFPAVFAAPPALQAALGSGYGAPCAAAMAAADALMRAWSPEARAAARLLGPRALGPRGGHAAASPGSPPWTAALEALEEPFAGEERRLALLAALLLPLRAAEAPGKKKGARAPATAHVIEVFYELNAAAVQSAARGEEHMPAGSTQEGGEPSGCVFKTAEDRAMLLAMLLHCADISNACKPKAVAEKWAMRVLEEFFAQGDRERAAGLAVSPMMDRTATSTALSQMNFIEFIVAPLYNQVVRVLPELRATMHFLWENRRAWHERYMVERFDPTAQAGERQPAAAHVRGV